MTKNYTCGIRTYGYHSGTILNIFLIEIVAMYNFKASYGWVLRSGVSTIRKHISCSFYFQTEDILATNDIYIQNIWG